jgi:Tol biopolymer transport system component
MSSLKTRPGNRGRPEESRRERRGVAVCLSPRPPGTDHLHDRSAVEWLRQQQALIEEARRRARRRRQRYGALALLGATVAVVVGFVRVGGVDPSHGSSPLASFGQGAATATNGEIAFADDRGRLQVVDPDVSGLKVIAHCRGSARGLPLQRSSPPGCWLVEPAWSPNGTQIAFVRGDSSFPFGRSTFSLYLRDSDGSVRRLTRCGSCGRQYGGRLSWSPDGSWIAFSRESGARGASSLWAVNTASGKLRRLTDCQSCADVSPDWAPGGQLIVFTRLARQDSSLYTVRADGSHLTKVTNSAANPEWSPGSEAAANPQWSPDGRKIAFNGSDRISIVDADGSDQKLLVDGTTGSGPGVPSWSPDGTKLAFFNTPGGPGAFTAEIWTTTADGSKKQRLYHSRCCVGSWTGPIWSPDGQKIAFAADSAGGTFVVAADGTGLRRLSTASANGLTWQRRP